MANYSKEQIIKLKSKGYSYKQIAEKLSLPLGTVKSVLSRCEIVINSTHSCKNCGKQISNVKGKKEREYCSDKCRYLWWNRNRVGEHKTTCPICKKEFVSVKKNRKFCSRACYILSRTNVGGASDE